MQFFLWQGRQVIEVMRASKISNFQGRREVRAARLTVDRPMTIIVRGREVSQKSFVCDTNPLIAVLDDT